MAKVVTDDYYYQSIAGAIRMTLGVTDKFTPSEMAGAVINVYNKGYEQGQAEGGGASGSNKLSAYIDGSLTAITAQDLQGITEIRSSAFRYSSLTSIEIPTTVTTIGSSAFGNITTLVSIDIPDSVTSLGSSLFTSCSSLTTVRLPSGLTSIGTGVFSGCTKLNNLVIPASVTDIGTTALRFGSSTNKVTITFLSTTPPTIATTTLPIKTTNLNKIIVPAGCGDAYKAATNWSSYADYIEEAA